MTIGILATGDEIIHGDTLNTNGYNIAGSLSSSGMQVGMQLACSDKEKSIVESIDFLSEHHDTVIIIGGLGPTSDDRTRFALANCLNIPLIEHEPAITHIQTRLKRAGQVLNNGNRQQAYFPSNATLLANPHGTALGCSYIHNGKLFILLPGPPIECLTMFTTYVLPMLEQRQPRSNKKLVKWRLFGASEGMIAEKLDNALKQIGCETGYRLERPYLEFKVICSTEEMKMVRQLVEPILAPYLIATPEQRASECLQEIIECLKQPIVIRDEATGGVLQSLIQKPSNFSWLSFKENRDATWYFHIQGLDGYWRELTETNTTDIRLSYRHDKLEKCETHTLPFYNQWIVNSAAEWIAFRIARILLETPKCIDSPFSP
ncbi:MAG: competence/damage-inducible protein A [Legionellaceae bacterium]|nr:competence/damage-inducible protein A [Legionellaceae bacterium]